ncbi:glycosyltransferase family 4 protein [Chromobacterium sp. IIBBL 290-4]|uniref:glycosyltransferase family 4 protein n=1 Tax=Chromobacterium sp. IIBBL 290-4 TaxID=2953890 RepID=UPI0020B8ADAB|nr:glycosyltransferase family 4 protein [Chromobacterium sp. IIBBL 290-4]UTH76199.1 glycosyltransferase family 4 protein [Chromobacterium sp. IIBBL 290-4]
MKILLIHQNFPGQLRHIADDLKTRRGIDLLAVGRDTAPGLPGVRLLRYKPHRQPSRKAHPYLFSYEDAVLHGQAVLRSLQPLARRGYRPDVILAHPGWGETLFLKDLFPDARLIHYCEFFYHGRGADADFDPEFPLSLDSAARLRARNALHLLNLENCDAGICPTHWQHSLHPAAYRDKLVVAHEGIRTEQLGPDPNAELTLPNGQTVRAGQKIITYVARNLEPYRGFHIFMRALPELLRAEPDCQVVVVGGDGVSYGSAPTDAANWREKLLRENSIDLNRVHFLGKVPYEVYRKVLQVSAVHVYLTYPFVLSWSLLEAMASGCRIVASDTAPLREVIRDGENGYLVGFFDREALIERVVAALREDDLTMRKSARTHALEYGRGSGQASYRTILDLQNENVEMV